MKQKDYKLLVCALAMANISAFSINNCFANVADNNVHENIVSAENLTEEEGRGRRRPLGWRTPPASGPPACRRAGRRR